MTNKTKLNEKTTTSKKTKKPEQNVQNKLAVKLTKVKAQTKSTNKQNEIVRVGKTEKIEKTNKTDSKVKKSSKPEKSKLKPTSEKRSKEISKRSKIIMGFATALVCLLVVIIPVIVVNVLAYPKKVFAKTNTSLTKVGYSAEYLGYTKRNVPTTTQDGGLPTGYPTYGRTLALTTEQKQAIINENRLLCAVGSNVENGVSASNTYNSMDASGNLYLNETETGKTLFKHTGSVGLYYGDVDPSELGVIKRITTVDRGGNLGYNITGLYAPAGEVIKITMSKKDLEITNGLKVYIGQCLYNGQANNIWTAKNMNRMPVIVNKMDINTSTFTAEVDEKGNYTFYVGSFFGGPIYLKPYTTGTTFSTTISGAVNYAHYILGYTTQAEYERNLKSSAPYFDLLVYDKGVLHSGPKKHAVKFTYDEIYDAAVLWEKISMVSTSVRNTNCGVVFLYDPFVAAGAAVAFPGRDSVNCPDGWMSGSLNYKGFVTGGAWGNLHEYNHNFQNWGISGYCDEVTNNAINLVEYSLFTKISSARKIGSVNEGIGGWNCYTSASWATRQVCTSMQNQLSVYATLLHSFGQENFIQATHSRHVDNYFTKWADLTHNDIRFYSSLVNISMTPSVAETMAEKEYPMFIPISSIYQTGRSYTDNGVKKYVETMQPYVIKFGETFTIDLNPYNFNDNFYEGGSVALPDGFSYNIKNITNPQYGKLEKIGENIYNYTPSRRSYRSGKIYVTLEISAPESFTQTYGNVKIDDVDLVLEFEQSYELNKSVLQRKVYTAPTSEHTYATAREAYENNYAGYTLTYDGDNINNSQNSNSDIWGPHTDELNTIKEVCGKLYVSTSGDYRIAVRGRHSVALYLSTNGGLSYKLAKEINKDTGSNFNIAKYKDENDDEYCVDLEDLEAGTWIYFKAIVKVSANNSFVGLGFGRWEPPSGYIDDKTGEYIVNGTHKTISISYANAYRESYQFLNSKFKSDYFYLKTYPTVYTKELNDKTLQNMKIVSSSECEEAYPIKNILVDDGNPKTACHSKNLVTNQPFDVVVNMGKYVEANRIIIQGYLVGSNQWHVPNSFVLYGGISLSNMQEIATVSNGTVSNGKIQFNFNTAKFRYYQLHITGTNLNRYVAFSYVKFEYNSPTGNMLSLDNDMFVLKGTWYKAKQFSTFGHIYNGKNASVEFEFTGTRFAINSYLSFQYDQFEILIDGKKVKKFEYTYSDNTTKMVYISPNLKNEKHKVVIRSKKLFNVDSIVLWNS